MHTQSKCSLTPQSERLAATLAAQRSLLSALRAPAAGSGSPVNRPPARAQQ